MSTNSTFLDLSECFQQLRIQNIDRDAIFQIGDRTFHADKAILMAKMKFFERMFTTDMRDKNETVIPLDPEIVPPEIFEKILNYVTKSMIDLSKVDLLALYRAADFFYFKQLMREIQVIMTMSMKAQNAILYRRIAIEFNLEYLEEACHKCIISNLCSNIDRTQLIPLLSYDELIDVLEKLRNLSREEDMFYYVIDWVNDLENDRKCELLELLKRIPLQALSFTFLKEVVSKCELIRSDKDCFEFLFEVIVGKPRIGDTLYVLGGYKSSAMWRGDVSQRTSENKWVQTTWFPRTPLGVSRVGFGCAVIGQKIYLCGGLYGNGKTNSLTMFDTHTHEWTQLTPMKHRRGYCAAAVLNGQIYVSGGSSLATVERYCPVTDQWSAVAPMTIKRSEPELVALNGFLYAIGGYNDKYALNSVERYNPKTDQWSRMSNTNHKYGLFGSAVLNGSIYIAGEDTCDVYNPTDDKWTEMPAPANFSPGRQLAVCNGKLYAIGGTTNSDLGFPYASDFWKGTKTVQVFDFKARVWRPEPDMDAGRSHHRVAVVRN